MTYQICSCSVLPGISQEFLISSVICISFDVLLPTCVFLGNLLGRDQHMLFILFFYFVCKSSDFFDKGDVGLLLNQEKIKVPQSIVTSHAEYNAFYNLEHCNFNRSRVILLTPVSKIFRLFLLEGETRIPRENQQLRELYFY